MNSVAACSSALAIAVALSLGTPAAFANSPPTVSNVVATQVPGTGQVRVTFDCADADGDLVTARLICSSNNGANFDLLPATIAGDANKQMAAGPGKVILWNAAADYPGRAWNQVVAKVYVSDGPATSGEMVLVPAGNFTMGKDNGALGNEGPAHTVSLDAFYIDKYEVTNAEFKQFIDAGGYTTQAFWSAAGWNWLVTYYGLPANRTPTGFDPSLPGFPVADVTYWEAEAYANFAGKRLPTEAEWEKAARGTDARSYPWGEGLDGQHANYWSSLDPYDNGVSPVGYFNGTLYANPAFQTANSAGPYGTYDQAGNVWEWVKDWYEDYSAGPVSNPIGPPVGNYKIVRGGGARSGPNANCYYFGYSGLMLNSWVRWSVAPNAVDAANGCGDPIGFRCARSGP